MKSAWKSFTLTQNSRMKWLDLTRKTNYILSDLLCRSRKTVLRLLKVVHLGQDVQLLHNVLQSSSKAWWDTRALLSRCRHAASKPFFLIFILLFSVSRISSTWSWDGLISAACCTLMASYILRNDRAKIKRLFMIYSWWPKSVWHKEQTVPGALLTIIN